MLAVQTNKDSFTYKNVTYTVTEEGPDFYSVSIQGGANIGIAYKDVVSSSTEGEKVPYALQFGRAEGLYQRRDGLHRRRKGLHHHRGWRCAPGRQ